MEYRALYSTIPKRTGETAGRNAWHYVSNSKGGKHCRNPITALNGKHSINSPFHSKNVILLL